MCGVGYCFVFSVLCGTVLCNTDITLYDFGGKAGVLGLMNTRQVYEV